MVLVSGEADTCGEHGPTQVFRALEAAVVCSRCLRNPGLRVVPQSKVGPSRTKGRQMVDQMSRHLCTQAGYGIDQAFTWTHIKGKF